MINIGLKLRFVNTILDIKAVLMTGRYKDNKIKIKHSYPDRPRSRLQKYRLTDLGKQILAHKE